MECGEEHWHLHQHVCPRLQQGGCVSLPASALQAFYRLYGIKFTDHVRMAIKDIGKLLAALSATFHVRLLQPHTGSPFAVKIEIEKTGAVTVRAMR